MPLFALRVCLAALLVVGITLPATGETKPKAGAKPAQAILAERPCSIKDAQGYKDALLRHDQARQAFRTKFRTGYYAKPGVLNKDLLAAPPAALMEKTAKAIATIADDRALLLLYDIGAKTESARTLCVWLIGAKGLIAVAASELPQRPVAFLARETLDVNIRAAKRYPVARKAGRALPPEPAAADGPVPPIDELSKLLLPGSIRAKLSEANSDRILILPVADLGTVPWPVLPLENGMLIDKAASVVLADVDWILHEPAPYEPRYGGVVVGDPDLSGDRNWEFSPIPASGQEAERVVIRWPAQLFVGPSASRKTVMAALNGRSGGLVYFATHGLSDPVNPMDGSFLALKDEHLYARDIKKLEMIERPLIVMSACQTGLGKVFDAGVFGLARAWWQAGASQIVMSLWNVDDIATRDLMTDFIGQLGNGGTRPVAMPREQALRTAMLKSRERDADPALWAAFTLFGLPTPSKPH
jgi:hypothetical protein